MEPASAFSSVVRTPILPDVSSASSKDYDRRATTTMVTTAHTRAHAQDDDGAIELQPVSLRRCNSTRVERSQILDAPAHDAYGDGHGRRGAGSGTDSPAAGVRAEATARGLGGTLSSWKAVAEEFWRNQISVVVPGEAARDHLALERTHLSYIRLATLLSLMSVSIAQLQVLQHAPHPSATFGYYVLGKPLAASLAALAILTTVVGGIRWWRWQQALLRGKALSGGWEMIFVGCVGTVLVVVLFGLGLAVEAWKEWGQD